MDRDGLFRQDMDAVLESIDSDRRVVIVGGGNQDRIQWNLCEHSCMVVKRWDAVSRGIVVRPGLVGVAYRDQLTTFQGINIPGVLATHRANADQGDFDLCHHKLQFRCGGACFAARKNSLIQSLG
jgi:hypothetical protein